MVPLGGDPVRPLPPSSGRRRVPAERQADHVVVVGHPLHELEELRVRLGVARVDLQQPHPAGPRVVEELDAEGGVVQAHPRDHPPGDVRQPPLHRRGEGGRVLVAEERGGAGVVEGVENPVDGDVALVDVPLHGHLVAAQLLLRQAGLAARRLDLRRQVELVEHVLEGPPDAADARPDALDRRGELRPVAGLVGELGGGGLHRLQPHREAHPLGRPGGVEIDQRERRQLGDHLPLFEAAPVLVLAADHGRQVRTGQPVAPAEHRHQRADREVPVADDRVRLLAGRVQPLLGGAPQPRHVHLAGLQLLDRQQLVEPALLSFRRVVQRLHIGRVQTDDEDVPDGHRSPPRFPPRRRPGRRRPGATVEYPRCGGQTTGADCRAAAPPGRTARPSRRTGGPDRWIRG